MTNAAVREYTGIHSMIRGLARLVETALGAVDPGNGAQMKLLSGLGLFAVEGTHLHHRSEDAFFWPGIVSNGADPAALDALVAEHAALDPILEANEKGFRAIGRGPSDAQQIAALSGTFAGFKDHLLTHLDHEEPIFFPLLNEFMPDEQTHRLGALVAKEAPRSGLSWLMGAVKYAMDEDEASEFLRAFPKPILWMRPVLVKRYRKNCATLGVDPAVPSLRQSSTS
jgi:hemerythrin-like domain-containing protein